MVFEPCGILRRTPRFPNQAIHVRAKKCARVVHDEERIELNFLQFALASNVLKARPLKLSSRF
jgi:hypothetical protein